MTHDEIGRWEDEGGAVREPERGCEGQPARGGYKGALRKLAVAVAGGSVLAAGVAMIVLPGPAILVIPLGLVILGSEFQWARRLLRYLKERAARLVRRRLVART